MKIAVWHNLPSGGGKRALYGQIRGLTERGHEIEAWCPNSAVPDYLALTDLVVEHRIPLRQPTDAIWLRFRPFARRANQLAAMDEHSTKCAAEMTKTDVDLFFIAPCVLYRVPRIGRFLRSSGKPVVLYLQEPCRWLYEALPDPPLRAPRDRLAKWNPRHWAAALRHALHLHHVSNAITRECEDAKSYSEILVNSYFSRESIARALGVEATVCYLGYDDRVFVRREVPRSNFVVGLGSMDYIKGVDLAINAVARLPKPRPALIWIANSGEPNFAAQMGALAKTRDVEFEIKTALADGDVVDLLNRAQLLLYTSRLEPFGYAPIEANACGTAVVAVAEGGVRETVFDGVNGLLTGRDPHDLAKAMSRLLEDPQLARKLGEAGERLAKRNWSMATSIDRLERELLGVLER